MTELDTVVVLTTLPVTAEPADFGRALVHEHLAACVTIVGEVLAVYRWQGEVCEDREWQLLVKTSRDRLEELERRVRQLHPFEVPEFIVLTVAHGSAPYLSWVRDSTRP
jgi:periplasmic divalent cation tolerance protein